jgi:hypothetical protein
MRRALGDAAISAAALIILLVMLVSVDDRVRDHLAGVFSPSTSEVADARKEISGVVAVVVDAIKDQSVNHAPLVIFGVAATVLVLFMLRT